MPGTKYIDRFFSIGQKYLVNINLIFNYSMFIDDFKNTSTNVDSLFPLQLEVYYPSASLSPLNYSNPYSNGLSSLDLSLNFNKTCIYFKIIG